MNHLKSDLKLPVLAAFEFPSLVPLGQKPISETLSAQGLSWRSRPTAISIRLGIQSHPPLQNPLQQCFTLLMVYVIRH